MGLSEHEFEPESECVPAFLFQGEKLVEVVFTEFSSRPDGTWVLSKSTGPFYLPEEIDHIIFETPVGCFETRATFQPSESPMYLAPQGSNLGRTLSVGVCARTIAARAQLGDSGEVSTG